MSTATLSNTHRRVLYALYERDRDLEEMRELLREEHKHNALARIKPLICLGLVESYQHEGRTMWRAL